MKTSIRKGNDLVPIWAESIIRRLNHIENQLSRIPATSDQNHEKFPRQWNNVDIELQEPSTTQGTKAGLIKSREESEFGVTRLELDYMNSSIHTRSTDTEFQLFLSSVSNIHR